jgi:hypothetical protein
LKSLIIPLVKAVGVATPEDKTNSSSGIG